MLRFYYFPNDNGFVIIYALWAILIAANYSASRFVESKDFRECILADAEDMHRRIDAIASEQNELAKKFIIISRAAEETEKLARNMNLKDAFLNANKIQR